MPTIFQGLKFKDQPQILALNPLPSFETELAPIAAVRIFRDLDQVEKVAFSLTFVITLAELDAVSARVLAKAQL